ncbi:hypothetical protein P153DRAFT_334845 [Dothidotthia symphoricarpi CBS 119687]|uniref:Septin-type G domain-containing protein n=1 Tax=Dothidotthia symphoricarpi CBS 119687 TaxID=1392245 RepID=A0A6A6AJP1_9PLEO|nr:uncharacterized protein P153DRAFT_334845 [Dothidotthia symphoricarpi CBS 119687]KAF2132192.1 hypothetical protein P153DRAFT_334845 [Dothidotthia symphoricarpi CBS 119687]
MRPLPGGDVLSSSARPRSRKSSVDHHHTTASSHVPTAFFLRREEEMEQSRAAFQNTEPAGKLRESTFGVQSLADTLEAAFGPEGTAAADKTAKSRNNVGDDDKGTSRSPVRKFKRKLSNYGASASLTPTSIGVSSPMPTSALPGTPRSMSLHSLKLSDEESALDDVASQVVTSSGEEEEEDEEGGEGEILQDAPSSFPQLVMPSIQMPTRRPFTTKGKAMGKLKVLVAGETGIGKTSLIRSVVQICQDIVHVDPLSSSSSFLQLSPPKSKSRKRKADHASTTRVTEIHASTKPYPHWWTDVEETRVIRRRKSSMDAILERNICFVDTPGYARGSSGKEDMSLVVDYVESLLYQTASMTSMEESDVLGVISGNGGVAIDVVIYLLPPNQDISQDVEFMQRLSSLTNVIPVIAKSETLSAQELIALKTSILSRLQATTVKPFFFGKALDDALIAVQGLSIMYPVSTLSSSSVPVSPTEPDQYPFTTPTYPHAISSTAGPDNDTMDASLLMSPDYVQPLLPSELTTLVNQVFDPESISWLRHCAAKKFLAWRRITKLPGNSFATQDLQYPRSHRTASLGLNGAAMNTSVSSSIFSAASPSGVLVPRSGSPFFPPSLQSPFAGSSSSLAQSETLDHPTDFSLTRYNTYAQGDQHLTEVRIAKWATDLQRSLRNERDRFDDLQRNERATWLLERVGEEVSRGTIVANLGGPPRAEWAVVRCGDEKKGNQRYGKSVGLDSRDPLGLCDFSDEVRRRGFVFVKVLGGVSVLGAVLLALLRGWGVEMPEGGVWGWIMGKTE